MFETITLMSKRETFHLKIIIIKLNHTPLWGGMEPVRTHRVDVEDHHSRFFEYS